MIAVFLNNKLITADTILPLMVSVGRRAPGRRIRYYCFDRATEAEIKRNTVLHDAAVETGRIVCLGRPAGAGPLRIFIHRLGVLWHLAGLFLQALRPRTVFIHFKALNFQPFRLLAKLRPRATLFVEANCWGYHPVMMEKVGNLGRPPRRLPPPGAGGVIVGFAKDWPELTREESAGKQRLVVPSTHLNRDWLDWVRSRADRYLAADLTAAGHPTDAPILVYILSYFGELGFLRSPDSMLTLFDETMDALAEVSDRAVILLKPHAITDRAVVDAAIAARPQARFAVTNLHPAVLATRAAAFVGNYYSTTFGDATAFGVPTVEYTDYSDETLAVTEGGSMRGEFVRHFLLRNADDPTEIHRLLSKLVDVDRGERVPTPADEDRLRPMLELLAA